MRKLHYSIRESKRAKNISLTISPRDGLVVVVPPQFNRHLIPGIVEKKRDWIEKHLIRVKNVRPLAEARTLPCEIRLPVVNEVWQVSYKQLPQVTVRVNEDRARMILSVRGDVSNESACRGALIRWLKRRAKRALGAALERLASQYDFHYGRMAIRGQRTRWGSCSSSGTISLNYKLLFLPPRLVRYVLVHELCHTIEMNHSAAFWQLVRSIVSDSDACRGALRDAASLVPDWVN